MTRSLVHWEVAHAFQYHREQALRDHTQNIGRLLQEAYDLRLEGKTLRIKMRTVLPMLEQAWPQAVQLQNNWLAADLCLTTAAVSLIAGDEPSAGLRLSNAQGYAQTAANAAPRMVLNEHAVKQMTEAVRKLLLRRYPYPFAFQTALPPAPDAATIRNVVNSLPTSALRTRAEEAQIRDAVVRRVRIGYGDFSALEPAQDPPALRALTFIADVGSVISLALPNS
ncbi:hypothetical protein Scel_24820 [Streptomyces cellostaticus]|nr:hypothetical protein Scel_24820 [Streptomyces cellostaticus]